ncbi:MAG: S9 family peptidase, partial [Phycisphaeraceae bacterium]|nr:S9 family peptidase [Phycisphaeraceae bacterium]
KVGTTNSACRVGVIPAEGGETTWFEPDGDSRSFYIPMMGWAAGAEEIWLVRLNRLQNTAEVMLGRVSNGRLRTVFTDRDDAWIDMHEDPQWIEDGRWFTWLSERDGWRHVYRYDYSGALLNRVTAGEFPVREVVEVDRERGRVFLLANAEARLYDTHLYRVALTGGDLHRLTEATGEHEVEFSPSRLYFVDEHSAPDRPPTAELRDVEGKRVAVLATADTSRLDAIGWTP